MAVTSHPRAVRVPSRRARVRRARPVGFAAVGALSRVVRRPFVVLWAMPLALRIVVAVFVILAVWSAVNWAYQVLRKPTELFFPVSGALSKTPPETWRQYGPLFRGHATAVMTPDLLAALAQVEGSGNPVARTYWRWGLTSNPLCAYPPASRAPALYP